MSSMDATRIRDAFIDDLAWDDNDDDFAVAVAIRKKRVGFILHHTVLFVASISEKAVS